MSSYIMCGGRSLGRRVAILLACYDMSALMVEHAGRIQRATEELRKQSERARKQMEFYIDEAEFLFTETGTTYCIVPKQIPNVPHKIGKPRPGFPRVDKAITRRYI